MLNSNLQKFLSSLLYWTISKYLLYQIGKVTSCITLESGGYTPGSRLV